MEITLRALICDEAVDPHEFLRSDPPEIEILREKVVTGHSCEVMSLCGE